MQEQMLTCISRYTVTKEKLHESASRTSVRHLDDLKEPELTNLWCKLLMLARYVMQS